MPWGISDQKSGDYVAHLYLRHQFEYDTYVVSVDFVVDTYNVVINVRLCRDWKWHHAPEIAMFQIGMWFL